jgi:hypothetical protein
VSGEPTAIVADNSKGRDIIREILIESRRNPSAGGRTSARFVCAAIIPKAEAQKRNLPDPDEDSAATLFRLCFVCAPSAIA